MTGNLQHPPLPGTVARDGRRRRGEEQRQRLVEATLRVVADGGVAAVSQRAVARQAGVSPAAVLYHFATVDDLLAATLQRCNESYLAELERAGTHGEDPLRTLADLVATAGAASRPLALAEFELVLRATRDPGMRGALHEWWDSLAALLEPVVGDPQRRRAVVATVDGLLLRQLVPGAELDSGQVHALLCAAAGTG